MVFPTAKEDTNPLESQSPDGGLMGFTSVALELIKSPCPEGVSDRLVGPFDKGLSQEPGAAVTPVDPGVVAAVFGDRSDAGELEQLVGGLVSGPIVAEGGQEARSQLGSGAGQGIEQGGIGVVSKELSDGVIEQFEAV